jgi:membrane-bound lytic murein transglycosylase D
MKPILKNYPEIPEDILLLPLLESGYNPHALSPSFASGIWQFIDGTSSCLGLKNDSYVDERRDVAKSTDAALRHLRSLYQQFGSWEIALAAYNAGSGSVRRTMPDLSRSAFWATVDRQGFRPETNEYVSRYAALMLIYKNTRRFGIEKDISIVPHQNIESVVFEKPVKIDLLAAQAGIPESAILKYNPELKGNTTPPYMDRYHLKITAELRPLVEQYARDPRWQM